MALGLLKCGGEITAQQKQTLVEGYQRGLNFTEKDAREMYSYASYLLGTDPNYASKLKEIAAPSLQQFTPHQIESALAFLEGLIESPTIAQQEYMNSARDTLSV